jgi:hypothetical protein
MCPRQGAAGHRCRWKRNSYAFARRWSSASGLAIGRLLVGRVGEIRAVLSGDASEGAARNSGCGSQN